MGGSLSVSRAPFAVACFLAVLLQDAWGERSPSSFPPHRPGAAALPRTARAGLREASVEQPGAPPSRVGLLLRNEPAHQVEAIPVSEAGSEGPVRGVGSRVIIGAQPPALSRHLHLLGRGSSRRFMPQAARGPSRRRRVRPAGRTWSGSSTASPTHQTSKTSSVASPSRVGVWKNMAFTLYPNTSGLVLTENG